MRCGNCFHAQADHSEGDRCVNRTDRLHVASGVSVVTVCGCKRYEDEVKPKARAAARVVAVEPEVVPEPEAVALTESVAEPPPVTNAHRARMGA
jgi:hypothetical protein